MQRGEDLKVEVPIGVSVFDANNQKIGELNEPGDTCIAARGGIGGCSGNNFLGTVGQSQVVTLDLKLIADVGMVFITNYFLCFDFLSKMMKNINLSVFYVCFRLVFQMPVKVHS